MFIIAYLITFPFNKKCELFMNKEEIREHFHILKGSTLFTIMEVFFIRFEKTIKLD